MKNISNMDKLFVLINLLLVFSDIGIMNVFTINYLNANRYGDVVTIVLSLAVINSIFIQTNMLRVDTKGDRLFSYSNIFLVGFSMLFLNISFVTIVLLPTTIQGIILTVRRFKKINDLNNNYE